MADTPDERGPEWWQRLTEEERAMFQRIMGKDWKPSGSREEETERAFLLTRDRIRDIERRALKKLRDDDEHK
jgi:DNA-directed RNA polymerase sigma subunit (sigma70/sigma32)